MESERILLIGDTRREVYDALARAVPGAQLTTVDSVFEGIAELGAASASPANARFSTVLAAAEPIERRPEAAVRALRGVAGNGRLILFGPATMELLSRKMLQFGCDDYLLVPAGADEIRQVFGTPSLRLATESGPEPVAAPDAASAERAGSAAAPASPPGAPASVASPGAPSVAAEPAAPPIPSATPAPAALRSAAASIASSIASRLPLADFFLDAQVNHPQDPLTAVLRSLNEALGPDAQIIYHSAGAASASSPAPAPRPVSQALSHVVQGTGDPEPAGSLDIVLSGDADDAELAPARQFLAQVAPLFGKLVTLQQRHNRLQRLAITDELTGLYNCRYFNHFLNRIVEKARQLHFPVTLLLFDIDDFKKYNDKFGHGVGDDILRQTAALMKRCTREHDLVARIGGDEFAVVFWDKEGPRQPLHGEQGSSYRPPQTPVQVFKRFQRLIATEEFPVLGQSGKGVLGISAGMAVFPYEAFDVPSLVKEADRRLMQLAKKNGKNTLYLVGTDDPVTPPRGM